MSATVRDSTSALSAEVMLVLGYSASRGSGNLVHRIIGTGVPDVTLHQVSTQEGTLSLLCADDDAAAALLAVLASPRQPLALVTDEDPEPVVATFIPTGQVVTSLDGETLTRWVVTVDFTEV